MLLLITAHSRPLGSELCIERIAGTQHYTVTVWHGQTWPRLQSRGPVNLQQHVNFCRELSCEGLAAVANHAASQPPPILLCGLVRLCMPYTIVCLPVQGAVVHRLSADADRDSHP